MSDNTSIEWADRTWNPLLGCERVSPGCSACYAINTATIRAGNPHPKVSAAFAGLTERRDGRLDWSGRINLLPDRLTQPLHWRKPSKVFVNSQSDLFHKDVPDEYIARVFAIMALTPKHTYQLLTKRHGRMRSWLNNDRMRLKVYNEAHSLAHGLPSFPDASVAWPLPNLWLGVSVEDQQHADLRIPALLATPAAVRWISAEPLLGPVSLRGWIERTPVEDGGYPAYLNWTVIGGESGRNARPMHPQWARSLRDQCLGAGVPFFFKQHGEYVSPDEIDIAGMDDVARNERGTTMWPDGRIAAGPHGTAIDGSEMLWRVGKKAAGRLLDGREWNEYPRAAVEAATR